MEELFSRIFKTFLEKLSMILILLEAIYPNLLDSTSLLINHRRLFGNRVKYLNLKPYLARYINCYEIKKIVLHQRLEQ